MDAQSFHSGYVYLNIQGMQPSSRYHSLDRCHITVIPSPGNRNVHLSGNEIIGGDPNPPSPHPET